MSSVSRSKILAIEGMPGMGKTTSLLQLAHTFEGAAILLSELNPEPGAEWAKYAPAEKGEMFHRLWLERMVCLKKLSSTKLCFLLDRSYFTNLAFTFGMDRLKGTKLYSKHLELVDRDFRINDDFTSLVIFEGSSETCLRRRKACKDLIPWPWSEILFLNAVQDFYVNELPKIYKGNILRINSDFFSKEQTVQTMEEAISPFIDHTLVEKFPIEEEIKGSIFSFAKRFELGPVHSNCLRVFGCPTVYFRKFSVQLEGEKPLFFTTSRLNDLIYSFLNNKK